ncbi:hypothetical protein FIBSPDRAFT_727453 [Athelia psychrophila]|uniref:Uncharacterized protein n=1 Tax=Athelia psychrophila TaxID=1759441 RepID=A0A166SL46_9AGAM|nr:hypothetical protein FIBSPDRAFT_727453 [Fibularhizoctonia sp. CBS 109695]
MDYLLGSSIRNTKLCRLGISYDIVCQWFKYLYRCAKNLPSIIQLTIPVENITPLILKFHLQAHKEDCHSCYSFNFCPGAGHTDSEGVEHNWDDLNGQAPSMCEMLPYHQWETLDDCAGWTNWRKTIGLGELFASL